MLKKYVKDTTKLIGANVMLGFGGSILSKSGASTSTLTPLTTIGAGMGTVGRLIPLDYLIRKTKKYRR